MGITLAFFQLVSAAVIFKAYQEFVYLQVRKDI